MVFKNNKLFSWNVHSNLLLNFFCDLDWSQFFDGLGQIWIFTEPAGSVRINSDKSSTSRRRIIDIISVNYRIFFENPFTTLKSWRTPEGFQKPWLSEKNSLYRWNFHYLGHFTPWVGRFGYRWSKSIVSISIFNACKSIDIDIRYLQKYRYQYSIQFWISD